MIEKREMIKMKFPVWEVRVAASVGRPEAEAEAGAGGEDEAEDILDVWHDFLNLN